MANLLKPKDLVLKLRMAAAMIDAPFEFDLEELEDMVMELDEQADAIEAEYQGLDKWD